MNNIADDFPFLPYPAPEIFSHIASSSNSGSSIFSPSPPDDQSLKKNRSKLRIGPSLGGIAKPKLGRKPDPGGGKVPCVCSECGKKFWSWKALFGHMRCHPERQWRGMNPPPNFRPGGPLPGHDPWSSLTEEDHEVAECLLMLANGTPANDPSRADNTGEIPQPNAADHIMGETDAGIAGRFECSSCKKVFGSHQALGGHRASHKNVKGCFALMSHDRECGDQSRPPLTELVMNSFAAAKDISDTDLNLDLRLGL